MWPMFQSSSIGVSSHKNEYKAGIRIGNWVEELAGREAADAPPEAKDTLKARASQLTSPDRTALQTAPALVQLAVSVAVETLPAAEPRCRPAPPHTTESSACASCCAPDAGVHEGAGAGADRKLLHCGQGGALRPKAGGRRDDAVLARWHAQTCPGSQPARGSPPVAASPLLSPARSLGLALRGPRGAPSPHGGQRAAAALWLAARRACPKRRKVADMIVYRALPHRHGPAFGGKFQASMAALHYTDPATRAYGCDSQERAT